MDEEIRDLERRAASDPSAWPLLARARLRAGVEPAAALAAVRAGLRAEPGSKELARIRDEALARFWASPAWRPLFERHGTGGERVLFSHDGALVAAAGRGVVVVDTEENRIVGAGYAGRTIRALAFLGRELLIAHRGAPSGRPDDGGLAHWDPASARERARVPGTAPTLTVATAADSTRGFAVTANGRVVAFRLERGRVADVATSFTLVPAPQAARAWVSGDGDPHHLAFAQGPRLVIRSGPGFEDELALNASGPRLVAGADGLEYALLRLGPAAPHVFDGSVALSPDRRAALLTSEREAILRRFDPERAGPVPAIRARFRAAAFSPCGSRLAVLYEDRLAVFEAC